MNARGHRLPTRSPWAVPARQRRRPHTDPIDSRRAIGAEGTLFIALRGERHDGHRYIPALIKQGVRCFR